MTYAIATVFYGVPASKELRLLAAREDKGETVDLDQALEMYSEDGLESVGADVLDCYSFNTPYSGSGGPEAWFGVELGGFDESEDGPVLLSSYMVAPTDVQKGLYREKLAELPDWLRNALSTPDVWVIWGSS